MKSAVSYLALSRGQTPDGIWHEAGSIFTTDAEEGAWMQPLDEDGRPIEKAKPKREPKLSGDAAIEAARREVGELAQQHIDGLTADHEAKLKEQTDRADAAEKLLNDAATELKEATKARDDARSKVEQLTADLAQSQKDAADLREKLAAFDRDGDGQPGGSKPAKK